MNNDYQALNYARQAIESFENNKLYAGEFSPRDKGALPGLLNLLDKGVKFMLPNRGEILESYDKAKASVGFDREWIDLMFLPYPITIFELPFEYLEGEEVAQVQGFSQQIPAPKRIALCWNPKEQDEEIQTINQIINSNHHAFKFVEEKPYLVGDIDSPDGFCLVVFYYNQDTERWEHTPAGGFYPYSLNAEHGENKLYGKPINLFPEFFSAICIFNYQNSINQAMKQLWHDIGYETWVVLQSLCVLNCQNIESKDVPVPDKLQKSRAKRGAKPLHSYKVLEIKAQGVGYSNSKIYNVGSGSSKSTHLRRGHLRRLASDKVIYVRATIVGKANKSVIDKDYSIKSSLKKLINVNFIYEHF